MTDLPAARFLDDRTPPHILTLTLMTGMSALSMNVFLPALPQMAEHFATDYRHMQYSVAIYLAMNGVLQLILGPVSDRWGRRPVLIGSFYVFVIATIGCVFAPNLAVFLAFRMLQAAVVAGMVLSRAVVRDMVSGDRAASMIAYVTMGMALVPMLAPMLGGYMSQYWGWQSAFWLQAGLGALVLWLTIRDVGETRPRVINSFREQFRAYPDLFKSPRFWGYSLAALLSMGSFFAYLGGAPFVGENCYGLEPGLLGVFLGAPAIGYLLGNYLAGRFSSELGINKMIFLGSVATGLGVSAALAIELMGHGTAVTFFALMSFVGLGNGLVLPNANTGLMNVRPELAGSASGLGGAMMIGGGALISGYVGSLLTVEGGPVPMLTIMVTSAVLALLCILFVVLRERSLQLA